MSILPQNVQNFFAKFSSVAEADVLRIVASIKADIAVIETDLIKAEAWVTSNLPQIITFLTSIETTLAILTGAGVPIPASTGALVAEALKYGIDASNALATYNADIAAGKSQAQSLADAYAAFVSAKAAGAEAAAALITVTK